MAYRDTGHGEHEHHSVKYFYVFAALCLFTGLSIVFDVVNITNPAVKIVLIMGVASAKATCVLLFFMHLKFEGNWKFILLAPTTILAIGLPIALMPDVAVNYYQKDVPQVDDYEQASLHVPHGHSDETHDGARHPEGDSEHPGEPEKH